MAHPSSRPSRSDSISDSIENSDSIKGDKAGQREEERLRSGFWNTTPKKEASAEEEIITGQAYEWEGFVEDDVQVNPAPNIPGTYAPPEEVVLDLDGVPVQSWALRHRASKLIKYYSANGEAGTSEEGSDFIKE